MQDVNITRQTFIASFAVTVRSSLVPAFELKRHEKEIEKIITYSFISCILIRLRLQALKFFCVHHTVAQFSLSRPPLKLFDV
jgi:hypothetical protein